MSTRALATVMVAALSILATLPSSAAATPVETARAEAAVDQVTGLPDEPMGGPYFVTQQYRDLLGREPDAGGLDFWVDRLGAGLSAAEMVGSFVDAPEFGQARQPSARIYLATLGRFPDEAGWAYWSQQLAVGTPLVQMTTWFIETPEGRLRVGQNDPDQLIDALYRNVLDRSADDAGRRYWTAQLAAGRTAAEVVLAFSESPEFRASVDDEILATLLYRGLLGRAPEPAGLAYWTQTLANGAPYERIVGGFLDAAEYERRLTGLWCRVIPDRALLFDDGPSPEEIGEENYFDAAYERMTANSFAILEAFNYLGTDVVLVPSVDTWPDRQFVLSMYTPSIADHCLSILALAPYPDQVMFHEAPFRRSELDAAFEDIRTRLAAVDAGWSSSGGTRIGLYVSSAAITIIDSIIADHGPMLEEVSVGAFPYPMPSPLPTSRCWDEPASAVDAASLGLVITVDLSPTTVRAGVTPSGTFTVTNNGTRTFTLWWGYEVTGSLGSGPTSASVFTGGRSDPLTSAVIGPGESATGRLDIGTESCDPAVGHRLPNGTYSTWGTINIIEEDRDDFGPNEPGFFVRLPAVPITLTD